MKPEAGATTKKPAADKAKPVTTKKSSGPPAKKPVQVIENEKAKVDSKKASKEEDLPVARKPGKSPARRLGGKKKKEKICKVVPAPKPSCNTTQHGCCPDGVSPAQGPFGAGKTKASLMSTGSYSFIVI